MSTIILVTDAWEPQVNGVVRTWQNVINSLKYNGHNVLTIEPSKFKTIPLPSYPEIRIAINPWKIFEFLNYYSNMTGYSIHIATEGPLGLFARIWCHKNNVPYTTGYHTKFPEYVHARAKIPISWTYKIMHWMHDRSHNVLVPTESMKKELEDRGFKNVRAWKRGVDTSVFNPGAMEASEKEVLQKPIYLCVSRVSVEKNLKAFFEMPIRDGGIKIMIGDGPALKGYKEKYPDVKFLGVKEGKELAKWYAAADVFVFPSKTDTFGIVMLEAMASGVPVAAYPVTGPIDIIENSLTGYMEDNIASAADKCLDLNREEIYLRSKQYRWSDVAEQLLSYLIKI